VTVPRQPGVPLSGSHHVPPLSTTAALNMTPPEHDDIIRGLLKQPACIASKYFYDERGSHLFEAITRLPEYYPTRTEADLMRRYGSEIARAIGPGSTLIELGAGNCEKSRTLSRLIQPDCFVGVDIAGEFLEEAMQGYRQEFGAVKAIAVAADLTKPVQLPPTVPSERRLVFYPGSSIGNFDPAEALVLLVHMRDLIEGDGGVLIGIDLPKDVAVLEAAYDDPDGVTAAFNLNALRHMNRLIDSNFDERNWQHCAFFNQSASRIEMHLKACAHVSVKWRGGGQRLFAKGERIHTENSYKYPLDIFLRMLQRAGFSQTQVWKDPRHWFAVVYARP
jgi:L-histidine N-alpha-methyltransferase